MKREKWKKKLCAAGCRTNLWNRLLFSIWSWWKNNSGLFHQNYWLHYIASLGKNTQAFKIKTLMFHLTQIHPPPEELPVSWTFLEQSNMRAFVPPTEATMKDTMTPGVHLCSLIFGRINSPAFVFSFSSKNLDQTQKGDLPTHGAEFHLKQHPLLLVTRQSSCTTHWLPNKKELV